MEAYGDEEFYGGSPGLQPNTRRQLWQSTLFFPNNVTLVDYGNLMGARTPFCPTEEFTLEEDALCHLPLPSIDPKNQGVCCGAGGGGPFVGNPINGGVGNKVEVETDYAGAGGFSLTFTRTYNSLYQPYVSTLGGYWVTNFDRQVLQTTSPNQVRVTRGDGKVYGFTLAGNVGVPDSDVSDQLLRLTSAAGDLTGWKYTSANDEVELYDVGGKLQSITNRAGLSQSLTYSDSLTPGPIAPYPGLLIGVTDASGRQLTFTYDSLSRVATMTNPEGGVTQYTYTFGNHLNLVSKTDPNLGVRTYLYNEQLYTAYTDKPYALTGIVDENQNRFATFQYSGAGQAVSTEHAGGVGKVSLNYGAASTTVTDSLGAQRTYVSTTLFGVVKPATITEPCPSCAGGTFTHTNTYDANGYPDGTTDLDGTVTDLDYNNRGLETQRIEAKTTTGSLTPAEKRTTQTDWHATFRVPTQRRVYNASKGSGTFFISGWWWVLEKMNPTPFLVDPRWC
jgi:YD repeat-containing protein